MKAKLVKVTDDIGVYYVLHGENLPENYVLSDKNCQAIERGYDLDELSKKACPDVISSANSAYKAGFQKALEILGNKKFTFDQMLYVAGYAVGLSTRSKLNPSIDIKQETLDFIHKMEQSEWDVEVEMEYYDPLPPTRQTSLRPKLDADGCLILKRK